jgi:hypothetical protein
MVDFGEVYEGVDLSLHAYGNNNALDKTSLKKVYAL